MNSPAPARERLVALDVFRGMTIAGMLLVNDPGTWSAIYPPLEHAEWNGWTPTDLIFPFFLFIAGVTTHLSLSSRRAQGADEREIVRQIVRRGAVIVLLGLLVNAVPFYPLTRFTHIRIPGVLQRIGLAYTCAALLTLRGSLKRQVVILVTLLYGYWFAMTLLPVPGAMGGIGANLLGAPSRTLAAWLDRLLLDGHLWVNSKTWDPEGPLSTIPAIGTAMLGVFAGRWLAEKRPLVERLNGLFAVGALGMTFGLMWNWSFPINKSLWTSSYVLFTAGMACVAIATISWIIDVRGVTRWAKPLVIYGVNPIVAFVGSGVMARLIYSLWKVDFRGNPTAVQAVVYETVFHSWLDPRNASLAFAVSFVLFWYLVLWILWRRNILLKV
ncbi:MAG: acyltransferase family protein [Gemmatimonadales bacterium]